MRHTVIIVGAGATLAEALPSKPRKQLTPPLDATFFDLCARLGYREQRPVREYMEDRFGINPFSGASSMEEVFNYIYTEAFSEHPTDECLRAYWGLIRMYRLALAATTNRLRGNSRAGVGALLRSLLESNMDRVVSFITFNQDLVIESAIQTTKTMRKYGALPWSIRHAYQIEFDSIVKVSRDPRPFADADPTSLQVLKMHGSLNWVYRVRSGTDPHNSLRGPSGRLICVNDAIIWPRLTQTTRGGARPKTNDLIPLVVPPVFEKTARYGKTLQPVWSRARKVLAEATDLIVFGYSFPDADFAAKAIVRQGMKANTLLRTVHVIDTSAAVAGKVVDIAGTSSCHYYSSVACFHNGHGQMCR